MDPLAEKYPNVSSYVYCFNNPVKMIDPDGKDIRLLGANFSSFTIKTPAVNASVSLSGLGLIYDFGGNYSLNMNNMAPDAIGVDLGASASALITGSAGINLLWHTRGENASNSSTPEIHTYLGSGLTSTAGANVNLGVFLGWASNSDGTSASNDYVANGVNWTGNFWSMGLFLGEGWAAGGGSIFTSKDPLSTSNKAPFWKGFELAYTPQIKVDSKMLNGAKKVLDKMGSGSSSGSWLKSYYWMIYGNGNDYLNKGTISTADDVNVSGWHIWNPIDPKDNK